MLVIPGQPPRRTPRASLGIDPKRTGTTQAPPLRRQNHRAPGAALRGPAAADGWPPAVPGNGRHRRRRGGALAVVHHCNAAASSFTPLFGG